jgi:hypothetical protein
MSPTIGELARMRGRRDPRGAMQMFLVLESRLPLDHPIRTTERLAAVSPGPEAL